MIETSFCICTSVFLIMYGARRNGKMRDSKGKMLGLMIVILATGLILIVSGYNGLLKGPLHYVTNMGEITSNDDGMRQTFTEETTSIKEKDASNVLNPPTGGSKKVLEREVSLINKGNSPTTVAKEGVSLAKKAKSENFYGIMIDAGSTGSRIHVFKFLDSAPGKPFQMIDDKFIPIRPGLSAHENDPEKAAKSLVELLDKAKAYIPEGHWSKTPIALKATAGLRLLNKLKSDAILQKVKDLFTSYPFKTYDDSVAIMEGSDEGVYSWLTVNFLKGTLGNSEKMVGVMDLGGGSTQITFTPNQKDTTSNAPANFTKVIDIFGQKFELYTHSYLGLGMMAGRMKIIGAENFNGSTSSTLQSPCFSENYNGTFEFGSKKYNIVGQKTEKSRFETCYSKAKNFMSNIHTAPEIQKKNFLTISYYYDKAVDAGIIEKASNDVIPLQYYFDAANRVCSSPPQDKAYLCVDFCHITALLHEGFKIHKDTKIQLEKTINGTEISWALGAMFDFFNTHKITSISKRL